MPLFQRARFKAPFIMEGEIKEFACFFYMVQGSMLSYDARGQHTLAVKEAILKNCGQYVQKYIGTEDSDECEAIAVFLYPELLKEIYKDEVPSFLRSNAIPIPKKLIGNKLIEQYMSNLSIYFEEVEAFDEALGILKLKELMMILLKSENHENIRRLLSDIFAPVNLKLKQVIENNLFNNLSLDQLAYISNMSLSTFKREFKKTFNDTPGRYIKNKRLELAASKLLASDASIRSIAFDTGFQDVTTFSASFRKKFNSSPSKFRLTQISN